MSCLIKYCAAVDFDQILTLKIVSHCDAGCPYLPFPEYSFMASYSGTEMIKWLVILSATFVKENYWDIVIIKWHK